MNNLQRLLAEIEAMPEGHIKYGPPYENRCVPNCPGCAVEEFKQAIKERFTHAKGGSPMPKIEIGKPGDDRVPVPVPVKVAPPVSERVMMARADLYFALARSTNEESIIITKVLEGLYEDAYNEGYAAGRSGK